MSWISVDERLPEIKQGVIVWLSERGFNEQKSHTRHNPNKRSGSNLHKRE